MVRFIRSIAFVLILCLLFAVAQNILEPAFSDDVSRERAMRGFESLEPNSVDVLFVGGSQILYGVQPMELYRDLGVRAYNLASFSQTIDCSYYMAKYAFLTQSPQIVFADASSIFSGIKSEERINAVWQVLMDALPVGSLKWEMARAYDSLSCGDGFLAGMMPFFKYHSRWSELEPKDFAAIKTEPYCLAGAWTNTGTASAGLTIEEENELADGMRLLNDGRLEYMSGDELYTETIEQPFYNLEISKEYEDYLLKLKELCTEHGAQLVLIKIPNLFYPQGGNGWPMDKSLKARGIAEEYQIPFYDLVYDHPDIVNYSTDSCDGGIHLNFRGASKATAWVGDLLSNTYHIQGGSNSVYDAMLFNYQKFYDIASLESELDFSSYLKRLSEHADEWTVFVSSMDDYTQGMTAEDYQLMENSLGLQLADKGQYANPYAAIIDRGKVLYEASSNRKIEYETDVDGLPVSLCSSGWFIDSSISIQIDGEEHAQGGRGLNIVVYDHASGQVIDSLSVDTYLPTKPITRDQKSMISYMSSYIHSSCFDYGSEQGDVKVREDKETQEMRGGYNRRIVGIRIIVFILLFFILFTQLQNIFVQSLIDDDENRIRGVKGFEALEPNTVDVLFLGTSQVQHSIQSMELYRDRRICSYNLASPAQSVGCSYFTAKYAFRKQLPRVVFLDVSSLFPSRFTDAQNGAYWRKVMDLMPFCKEKLEMIKAFADLPYGDSILSGLFPIVKYHSSWNELHLVNFKRFKTKPYALGGSWINTIISPSSLSVEDENMLVQEMENRNDGWIKYYNEGKWEEEDLDAVNLQTEIDETELTYLSKLKQLCEESGAELVLIKVPVVGYPQKDSYWSVEKSNAVKQLMTEYQLPFYDFVYDYPETADFTTDSIDGGTHLNYLGAKKLTKSIGTILNDMFPDLPKEDPTYDAMLSEYERIRIIAELQSEDDFAEYIRYLGEHDDDWTIYICTSDDYTSAMTPEDYALLEDTLGIQAISNGQYADTYAAIIDKGDVLYEASSNQNINVKRNINGVSASLKSSGWYSKSDLSIEIDGDEYAQGWRGLNFVVYDNVTSQVIDSVSFDTFTEGKPAARNAEFLVPGFISYANTICDEIE